MTALETISDVVEMMKGELSISYCHYNGWNASIYNKHKTKYWDAQFTRHEYDRADGFHSIDAAVDALLLAYNNDKFKELINDSKI
jgi:hypothetical protein